MGGTTYRFFHFQVWIREVMHWWNSLVVEVVVVTLFIGTCGFVAWLIEGHSSPSGTSKPPTRRTNWQRRQYWVQVILTGFTGGAFVAAII
jgi:hypothetical protein